MDPSVNVFPPNDLVFFSPQVDVYSFGILLYELVCEGHNPFQEMEFRTEIDEAVTKVTSSGVGVIDLFQVKPIENSLLGVLSGYSNVITVEEQCLSGGFGSAVIEAMADAGLQKPIKRLGLPDRYFFENGGREYLLDRYGLAIADLVSAIDAFSSA